MLKLLPAIMFCLPVWDLNAEIIYVQYEGTRAVDGAQIEGLIKINTDLAPADLDERPNYGGYYSAHGDPNFVRSQIPPVSGDQIAQTLDDVGVTDQPWGDGYAVWDGYVTKDGHGYRLNIQFVSDGTRDLVTGDGIVQTIDVVADDSISFHGNLLQRIYAGAEERLVETYLLTRFSVTPGGCRP